jgi:hypothetical protein
MRFLLITAALATAIAIAVRSNSLDFLDDTEKAFDKCRHESHLGFSQSPLTGQDRQKAIDNTVFLCMKKKSFETTGTCDYQIQSAIFSCWKRR